jgi:hypothetical protein
VGEFQPLNAIPAAHANSATHDNSMLAFYPTNIQFCFQSFVYGTKLPKTFDFTTQFCGETYKTDIKFLQ